MTRINDSAFTREMELQLSLRRKAMRKLAEQRKADIAKNYPDIAAAQRELTDIAIDISSKIIKMPQEAEELRRLGGLLLAEQRRTVADMLAKHDLPPDYLEAQYVCHKCRDTGRVGGEICGCIAQFVVNAGFAGSGINYAESFANFDPNLYRDEKQRKVICRIRDYCESYAADFPTNDKRDLLLIGYPGVGKTFLLNCIGGRVLGRGHSVLKLSAYRLMQIVMDSFRNTEGERPDFSMPELLIIDDLGAEPMINNVTVETLLSILCERQDANKATLTASNYDIDTLKQVYGERVASRLLSPRTTRIIEIKLDDIRLVNKQ